MSNAIGDNDLYEIDYSNIEELRVLLGRMDRSTYTNKTGMLIQGIDPWTSDARDRRRARPNRIYSDFLYMLYSMFAVNGVEFQRNPQKFVDIYNARLTDFVKATERVYRGAGALSGVKVNVR